MTDSARRSATVIVTHDREELLPRVVAAHLDELEAGDSVVIVDCASRVPAAGLLSDDDRVCVVRSEENLGPAGGFALGMEVALDAGADDLWLCNDDDLPIPGARRQLRAVLHELGPHALVAGLCVRSDGSAMGYGSVWRRGVRRIPAPAPGATTMEPEILPFVGLFVTREAAGLAGPVRADFFMMGEEHDFCLRCVDAGARVVLDLRPAMLVQVGETAAHDPPWRGYYQARNNIRLSRDRADRWATTRTLAQQLKLVIGSATIPDRRLSRVALRLRGLVDGFRGVTGRTLEPR